MSEPTRQGTFQQKIGLFDATMLVAGSMIGSGIFIVSAGIVRDVGSSGWLLFIWALTGLITIMGALSYAELAGMMPKAGGQYVYLREAYGPLSGFLYGWTCFLVIQTGFIAAVSVAFAKYLGVLVPMLGTDNELWAYDLVAHNINIELYFPALWLPESDWPIFFKYPKFAISAGQLVAVCVAVVLTIINCFGVQGGKLIQNVFTVTKLASLAILFVLGMTIAYNADVLAANFADLWGGIWTTKQFKDVSKLVPSPELAIGMVVAAAMVGSLFSSDSWNNVTFTAGETKDPKRNLPRSLAIGTIIVTVLYLLVNITYLAALPIQGDMKGALQDEIEARKTEATAAKAQANVSNLQAELSKHRLDVMLLEESRNKLDGVDVLKVGVEAIIPAATQVKQLDAEIEKRKHDITLIQDKISNQQKELTTLREKTRKLDSEAAFKRGISGAKDDRVGTAVLERASPNLGVPLMALAIMISTFGCVNGLVLAGPPLLRDGARRRLLPVSGSAQLPRRTRSGIGFAMHLVDCARLLGDLQRSARLHHLRRTRVLCADRCRLICAQANAA